MASSSLPTTRIAAAARPVAEDALAQTQADADASRWRLRLLGGFELDDGRHRLTRLRSRAAMSLLARVALAPTRDHAREELAALLWPEADAEAGRNRLRQTLSLLRAVLEPPGSPPVLLADRRVVRVAPAALWCDAVAFETAMRQHQADRARTLWRGDLLPGFYDEWITDERLRLAALYDRIDPPGEAAGGRSEASAPPQPTAPAAAPGLRLPSYLTRLIGADQAGARLLALIGAHRLVSVLGPGGAGKTRLAVEVAQIAATPSGERRVAFDGAVFVSLVDAADRTALLDRLLQALRLGGGGVATEQIEQALGARRQLLVLDNAEQLDDGAIGALAALAESLPGTHWLVTTRRPLELDGEHTFVLGGLPLPDAQASLAELAMNPAVALLVDRVRAHRPDFHVTAAQRPAVVALAHWLDGLPLALELAATQLRTQGPADLLALLRRARDAADGAALDYLARRGTRRGGDPRHASMRAVVEGSWRLLDGPQRAMLLALSLLPAGATASLAAAIGAGPPGTPALPPTQAQAVLDALVAQSVLRAQAGTSGVLRYAPHDPVREFALARLDDAGRRALRWRLLDALLAWAREMPETQPLAAVRDELPTLAVALSNALADGRANDAASLMLLLQGSWGHVALPDGLLAAFDRLLDAPGLDDGVAAAGHGLAAMAFQVAGGRLQDVRRHMAAALVRPHADPLHRAMALTRISRLRWRVERDPEGAREMLNKALQLARSLGRQSIEANLISQQAAMAVGVDRDPVGAQALTERALALHVASGNRHLIAASRYNRALYLREAGRPAEALDELEALIPNARDLQSWEHLSNVLEARGTTLARLRRWDDAAASLCESVAVAWAALEMHSLAIALWNLPPVLARQRRGELAAETMGAAETLWRQRFGEIDDNDRRELRCVRRMACLLLGSSAADAAWRRGAQRPLADAVRAVLAVLPTP